MYTATMELSDGRIARLAMPDFYTMIAEIGDIPSPEVAAVLQLLDGAGTLPKPDLRERLKSSAEHYARLYAVASACLEWPRLILVRRKCRSCGHVWDGAVRRCLSCQQDSSERVDERGPDELGPRDLSLQEISNIYLGFFLGRDTPIKRAGDPENAHGPADIAPARNGVPHDAEPVPEIV